MGQAGPEGAGDRFGSDLVDTTGVTRNVCHTYAASAAPTTPKPIQNSLDDTPSGTVAATATPVTATPAPTPANITASRSPRERARNCVIVQAMPVTINAADAMPATNRNSNHAATLTVRPIPRVHATIAARPHFTAGRAATGQNTSIRAPTR